MEIGIRNIENKKISIRKKLKEEVNRTIQRHAWRPISFIIHYTFFIRKRH